MPGLVIDYQALIATAPEPGLEALTKFLSDELPYEWVDAYIAVSQHKPYLLRIQLDTFEYIFDACEIGVRDGLCPIELAVENRVVAVHGRSAQPTEKRKDSQMRGRPLGPIDCIDGEQRHSYDKGHFIGHSLGGGLEINIFPQLRDVNRGWGGNTQFREMERYCAANPETYCFLRPSYAGKSWHPDRLEYGLLRADGTLWLERFANAGSAEELAEIERLIGPAILDHYSGGTA